MKRALPISLLLLAAACGVDNGTSVEVDGRAAPDSATTCAFKAGGEFQLGPGVLDLAQVPQPVYSLVVYVRNNMADPKLTTPESVTAARAWNGYAAHVRVDPKSYVDAFGPNPPLPVTSLQTTTPLDGQSVQPAGGTSALHVEAVSGTLGAQLGALLGGGPIRTLVLGIKLEGQTNEGQYIETAEWFFPLKICSGCLAAPTCAADQVLKATNCFSSYQDSAPICASAI